MLKRLLRRLARRTLRAARRLYGNQPKNKYEAIAFDAIWQSAYTFGGVA